MMLDLSDPRSRTIKPILYYQPDILEYIWKDWPSNGLCWVPGRTTQSQICLLNF